VTMGRTEPWRLVADNFKNNDIICDAIEAWIEREDGLEPDIAIAALVGRRPKVKRQLLEAVSAAKGFIHWPAYALLEGWGVGDAEVRDKLLPLARNTTSGARIAHLLPRIVGDGSECRDLLMSMLRNQKCPRPDFVIAGLRNLDAARGNAEACTLALGHEARAPAAHAFGVVGDIILAFADDSRVRELAIAELGHVDGNDTAVAIAFSSDPDIRARILHRLAPLPTRLRDNIVTALADRPIGDHFSTAQLGLYELEYDPEVKTKASIAFHRRLARSGEDASAALAALQEGIVAYGVQQAARRQAALCGLIALDRLDVFRDAREDGVDGKACAVPLSEHFGVNYALLHWIGQHWTKVRESVGPTLEQRLVGHIGSTAGLPWDDLGIVAAEYPTLAQELLGKIESRTSTSPATSANILKFVAVVRPKSLLLRERCLEVLRSHKSGRSQDETDAVAAELLASHYKDGDTFIELLRMTPLEAPATDWAFGPLLALADGWLESAELKLRSQKLVGRSIPWDLYFALGPSDPANAREFISALSQFCRQRGPLGLRSSHRIFRFCVRHVARQDQSYELLLNHFLRPMDQNLCVSAPALLATARGVGPLGRLHLVKRLEGELSGQIEPTVGYDLRADDMRSWPLALLDVLSAGEARSAS
jgi:hypothetical protein